MEKNILWQLSDFLRSDSWGSQWLWLPAAWQDDNPRFKTAEGHRTWCPKDRKSGTQIESSCRCYCRISGEFWFPTWTLYNIILLNYIHFLYSYIFFHIIFILCSLSKSGKSSSFRFFLPYMFFTSWTHGLVLGLDSSLVSFPGHLSLIVMRFWQLDFTNVRTHAWAKQWSPWVWISGSANDGDFGWRLKVSLSMFIMPP